MITIKEIQKNKPVRVILSGGGTAGHIYPAVAVAEELTERYGDRIEVLFVGARGKMEMQKVSALGYPIIGLPIVGLQRKLSLRNLKLPFKLMHSMWLSRRIIRQFDPQVVIGTGGYASAPILRAAQNRHIPTMLWEGNSFAGMANRMLGRKADKVFVSYKKMERFFDKEKIVLSGTPLRGGVKIARRRDPEAYAYFGLSGTKPVLLVTGGSLGTRAFNEGVLRYYDRIGQENRFDLIWQAGSYYYPEMVEKTKGREYPNIKLLPFVDRMDHAYGIADLIVGRGGASTVAELSLIGASAMIIPSSNVAEDHQRHNALALVEGNGVVMLEDRDTVEQMIPTAERLLFDPAKLEELSANIRKFAQPRAANIIADEIVNYIKE